jgi:hypothetical protein
LQPILPTARAIVKSLAGLRPFVDRKPVVLCPPLGYNDHTA